MPTMPRTYKPRFQEAKQDTRPSATRRGYGSKWRKRRARFLRYNPLCRHCLEKENRVTPANVVDHIIPHKGDQNLFWDEKNWQSLCYECHNRKSATEK